MPAEAGPTNASEWRSSHPGAAPYSVLHGQIEAPPIASIPGKAQPRPARRPVTDIRRLTVFVRWRNGGGAAANHLKSWLELHGHAHSSGLIDRRRNVESMTLPMLHDFGTRSPQDRYGLCDNGRTQEATLNGLIYLIGLIVVIMAILSFFGLR